MTLRGNLYIRFLKMTKPYIQFKSVALGPLMIYEYLRYKHGPRDVLTCTIGNPSSIWGARTLGNNVIFSDITRFLTIDLDGYYDMRGDNSVKVETLPSCIVMPTLYGGFSTFDHHKLTGDEIVVLDATDCLFPTCPYDYAFFDLDGEGAVATDDQEALNYFNFFINEGKKYFSDETYQVVWHGGDFKHNDTHFTLESYSEAEFYDLPTRRDNYFKYRELLDNVLEFVDQNDDSTYTKCSALTRTSTQAVELRKLFKKPICPLLHKAPAYGSKPGSLPKSERIIDFLVNLPVDLEGDAEKYSEIILETCLV